MSENIIFNPTFPISDEDILRYNLPYERVKGKSSRDRQKAIEEMRSEGLLPPVNEGFLSEMGQGAGLAVLDVGRGIGSTLEEVGFGSGLKDFFEEAKAVRQHWNPDEDYSAMSLNPGNLGRTLGSGVAQSAMALGAGATATLLTGGNLFAGAAASASVTFGQTYGDIVKEYREAMPNQKESTVKGLAFISAAGQSLMESVLGPERLAAGIAKRIAINAARDTTKSLVRRVGKEVAQQMISEGSEEVSQDFWNRCVKYAGTENFELPSWNEVGEQFFGGAIPGGVLGGAGALIQNKSGRQAQNVHSQAAQQIQPTARTPLDMEGKPLEQPPAVSPNDSIGNAGVQLISKVAEELGLKVHFFDEDGAPEQKTNSGEAVNGWYDEKKNEIWIDRNDPDMNPMENLGHEFKHFLDRRHGELVKNFDELMKSGLNDAGKQALHLTESEYASAHLGDGNGFTELSADTFGKMWTDPDFWRDVASQAEKMNAGMGQKLMEALKEYLNMLRSKLKKIGTPEAKEMFDNFGALRDEAVKITAEIKRRNGRSTPAENVVGATGNSAVQSVPVSEIHVDPARFQFKSKANQVTGVDESNQLGGEYDPKTAGNLYLWEDNSGKKFAVNGHHRLSLAQNSKVQSVNAIVDREADGVTAEQARRNGVLINIRDEQGDIQDYADFVRHEKMDEATAEKEGILAREKGRTGYLIGRYASDNLFSIFKSGDLNAAKTSTIADIARGDEALEAAGIRAAKNNMPNAHLKEFLNLLKNTPRQTNEQGDLFGFDDSAIKTAETLSKLAAKHIREVGEKVNAAKHAIKNPDAARKLGVKVKKDAQKLLDNALLEQQKWEHWYTDSELTALLRKEAGIGDNSVAKENLTTDDVSSNNIGNSSEKANSSVTKENLTTETSDAQKNGNIEQTLSETERVANDQQVKNTQYHAETTEKRSAVQPDQQVTSKLDFGRFNQDSDTPLLSAEEDANDFQLYDETPAEAAKRDSQIAKEEQAAKERAQKEAAKATADLPMESEASTQQDLPTLLRNVINMNVDGHIKQQRLLRIAKQLGMPVKEIQERCEAEVVAMGREINAEHISNAEKYQKLIDLYNRQPSFTKRTSTSVANQAYSTPVPLAWLLGKRIGLAGQTVYEPTAGTGMLTIAGDPALTSVNEIDILRHDILSEQGFKAVTSKDAAAGHPGQKFDRVIMNPPFGAGKKTSFDGYDISKLDHIIAIQALGVLPDNGRAAMIVGANTENRDGEGRTNLADFVFMNYLYDKFNVKDNYIVSGDLYRKQGASYPVRIITIDGRRKPGEKSVPIPEEIEILKDWTTIYKRLEGELNHGISETGRSADAHTVSGTGEQGRSTENNRGSSAGDPESLGKDHRDIADRAGSPERSGAEHEQQPGRSGRVGTDQSGRRIVSGSSESVDHNRGRVGNSTETVHGETARNRSQTGTVSDGKRTESKRSGTSVRSDKQSSASTVSSKRIQVGEQRGELNNSYVPASQSSDKMDVVVPRFMAESVEHSLARVEKSVGNLDAFVQRELGYATPEELYHALSDVQIDGVAQAINAIRNGDGFVLGDQTGIGKGRQCAAVMRWAQNHGVMPIFLTRDQNLFTDMYRDGKDIGSTFNPLIVASDAEKANITDNDGKVIVGLPKDQARAFSDMIADKSPYDAVFIPYSQLSQEGRQRDFLRNLIDSRKCMLVMDEAHEASGDSARGKFFYDNGGILHKDVGVLYASATFAKRPDNMGLYFRTNIRKAVDNIDSLKKVLAKGGVPLQQLLSSGLARDGQYTRRERDFTGVTFDTIIAEPTENTANIDVDGSNIPKMSAKEKLIDRYDRVAYVLGRLTRYSELIRKVINKAEKGNYGTANTREGKSIQMASFASVTHNYIAQLLLASKCDIIVERAERAHKAGQKPVIALTNTLESVLKEFVSDTGIENGDPLSMKFSNILESAMLRMYKFTKKSRKGKKEEVVFDPADYGLEDQHEQMLNVIHELDDIDLPISPIDYIKHKLEQKGIRTGEITGRTLTVNYDTAVPTLAARSSKEKNKNRNVNDFNSGKLDAIILNASGSTGLSLHSSVKFADRKQRNMIMAQPSLDIAIVQQMFGRVLRSGQVNAPAYEILSSPLAAERRPMMVLSRKLQSLNANTTANNKGAVSLGLDFMNKYGDAVAQQFLNENPEIANQVDIDTSTDEDSVPEDLMTKLTGRMAVLPDSTQQEILDNLVSRYSNLVDFLKKTGNYDLEITVHEDWDVISEEAQEIASGDPNGSIFQQPVMMKQISIQEQRNIRDAAEVRKEIQDNLGKDRDALREHLDKDFARAEKGIDELEKQYQGEDKDIQFINERKILLRETLEAFKRFMINNAYNMMDLMVGEDAYSGTITGYRVSKYKPRSPIVASEIMIDFAVTDTIGKLTIPFSRFRNQQIGFGVSMQTIDDSFTGEKRKVREQRYAITGNLLRGLEYAEKGKVVSYKTHDGNIESALLMPKNWQPDNLARDPRNEIHNIDEAMEQLSRGRRGVVRTGDGLNIIQQYGTYYIEVPRAKNKGGKYFLDKDLLHIINGEFSSYGRIMRTERLTEKQVRKAIGYLINKEDTYLKKDDRIYSLKRHRQVNPVRDPGDAQSQHQERIKQPYETRSNETVNAQAMRRIFGNGGMGETINMMLAGDFSVGSDVSQRILQLVLNSQEYKNLNADARAKISDIYIKSAGTEIARSLAARRLGTLNYDDIQSIQAHINAFMSKIDKTKPKHNLRQQILDEFGFDVDNLPEDITSNPRLLDALIRRMASARAGKFEKAYEYWINAILSAPTTHAANAIGNTFNAGYELGIKRLAEAIINVVAKRKDAATFGEFRELTRAVDWKDAFNRAKLAFDLETLTTGGKLDHVRTAIGGELGRIVRIPGRLLRAADEFAKAIVQPMEATAYAYREGKNNGLSGNDLQQYIETQLKQQDSSANAFGRQRALELTFQEDPGKAVNQLLQWREAGGVFGTLLKFVLPFVKTPHNIMKQGIRKSPLGAFNFAFETGKLAMGKRKFDADYVSRMAEQLVAWGIVAMIAGMDDDDDMPFLTGTSPRYGSAKQKFKENKIPPYSIRIGNNYYSYKRIEPLSTSLAFIADGLTAYRAAKNGEDGTRIMKRLIGGVKQLVVEKSFLDSLGEINRIVSDPERSAARYFTNFAASWMPNVVRQTVNAFDDNVRDNKTRAKGLKWWEDQFNIVTNSMGITKAAPKYDYFGREIKKDSLADSGVAWQMMRFIPIKPVNPDSNMNKAELLIWNYNQANPEKEYYPDVPSYYFQRNSKKLYFEGKDYSDFVRESGQLALKQINYAFSHGLLKANKPTEKDIALIKKIFTRARKEVRDQFIRKGRYESAN